jgi:hypothetical protein
MRLGLNQSKTDCLLTARPGGKTLLSAGHCGVEIIPRQRLFSGEQIVRFSSIGLSPQSEMHSHSERICVPVSFQPVGGAEMPFFALFLPKQGVGCVPEKAARKLILSLSTDPTQLVLHDELVLHELRQNCFDKVRGAERTKNCTGPPLPKLPTEDAGRFKQAALIEALLFDTGLGQ